jgi:hypothetical protein
MKYGRKTLSNQMIFVAVAVVGCAAQTPAPPTPTPTSDSQIECVGNCCTLHDCCIKSCNWVETRSRNKCINKCNAAVAKCYQECE